MNDTTTTLAATGGFSRTLRILGLQTRAELLKTARLPAYALPTLAFPWLFYLFFGIVFGDRPSVGSVTAPAYLLATYGVFGVIGASLFGFGVGLAVERAQGWLLVQRATPMPPMAALFGRLVTALVFSGLVVAGLFAIAAALGGVHLGPLAWLSLAGILLAGSLPFCAFGLALGLLCGPNSAPAVVNLIYLPMSFLSGLWLPVEMLPSYLRAVAPFLPPYHLARLALARIGVPSPVTAGVSFAALAGFTALSLVVALWAWRRDEGRTWG